MSNAETYLASLLDDAVAKVPQARDFRDFLWTTAGVRLRDVVDHMVLPHSEHGAHGWAHVAPGIWRSAERLPALLDGEAVRIAVRVDDVEALLAILRIDAPIDGESHGPYRRVRLFEAGGVAFDAVERCGWTGFDLPETNERRIRRARIHYQTLASRRRSFRDAEQGYSHLTRMLEAAVTELGPHWASGVFARAEMDYWRAHCAAAQDQGVRQARAGIGWANATQIAFASSRAHFHRAAGIARMLGYRQAAWRTDDASGAGAQVFECPLLSRPSIVIECDGPDAPVQPLVTQTWLAAPGLWCALHGDGMLDGGARSVTLRCEPSAAGAGLRRPINPSRVDALERERYLTRHAAEELRLSGAEGGVLHSDATTAIAPYGQLAAIHTEWAEPQPRRQRHRIKRQR